MVSGAARESEKPQMYATAMRLNHQVMDYADAVKDARELEMIRPLDDQERAVLMESEAKSAAP